MFYQINVKDGRKDRAQTSTLLNEYSIAKEFKVKTHIDGLRSCSKTRMRIKWRMCDSHRQWRLRLCSTLTHARKLAHARLKSTVETIQSMVETIGLKPIL